MRTVIGLIGSSAFAGALVFGVRHGFDWDHLAALGDLTATQSTPRRSMWLATLYALGHACTVLALGGAAIVFAEQVPPSADALMGRIVGVTLIVLGIVVVHSTVVSRADGRMMRSRWMLLGDLVSRLVARRRAGEEIVVIEHSHHHDHSPTAVLSGSSTVTLLQGHTHRHVAPAPRDPFVTYGPRTSLVVGMLHGIGAETPTQLLVFAAAAHADGRATSIGLLLCFVAGLVAANTVVAAAGTAGAQCVLRHRAVALALATTTATCSLVVGAMLLLGRSAVLPSLLGG